MTASEIVRVIEEMLRQPVFFRDVLERLEGESYRLVLRAWGEVRQTHPLDRDELGRYVMAERSSLNKPEFNAASFRDAKGSSAGHGG